MMTRWYYLSAKIDNFELYEILEPVRKMWTKSHVYNWLVANYGKLIKDDTEIFYKIDEIEFNIEYPNDTH